MNTFDWVSDILDFSIIVPIVIGSTRIRTMEKPFAIYWVLLVVGFINESIYYFIHTPLQRNIREYSYLFIETLSLTFILLCWRRSPKRKQLFLFYSLFLFGAMLTEILMAGMHSYRVILVKFPAYSFLVILSIATIDKILSREKNNGKIASSKLLILIPTVISCIYTLMLMIVLQFFYAEEAKRFFIVLYRSFITSINFLSYLSFSLAFLWAPKKEKFLSYTSS
jgi:hypothetical protein